MGWQFTLLSLPILVAVAVSFLVLGYLVAFYRDRRHDVVIVIYFVSIIAAIIWTVGSLLKLLHTDPTAKLAFYRFLHVGAVTLPPLMFLFVVAFTDRTRWLRYDVVGAVFLVPVAFLASLFFGPDGLIIAGTQLVENDLVILRVEDGPGFVLFSIYSTLLVLATLGLVIVEIRHIGPAYYPQALLLGVAVVTPMIFFLLTIAGVFPFTHDYINLVPTSAAVSIVAFGMLLYRYRLVDLPPLAYTTAMKYSPDALFVLDENFEVRSTNEHGRELLDALASGLGASLSDAISDFDPESMSNELIEIDSDTTEGTHHRVFGEPFTRGGKDLGWVVVLRDETEQQRQQQRLRRKNEQMELLTSTISHDLKNPLSVAQGYLELAQTEFDSEELDHIENAHDRMAEIIEKMLTLAKAGRQRGDLRPVHLKASIERAWEHVETDTATLIVEDDRTIMADPTMIQHVFENLFRNAVEHAGDDVTITVGCLEDGFYVTDDGVGIPPEDRDDVFDVGYSSATGGTGFGMSIIRQIVTAHDWEIDLTAGTDGGARFEFTGVEVAE